MRASISIMAVAAILLAGCGDLPAGPGRTHTVTIRDNSFTPQTLIIQRGANVRWNNTGSVTHTVVADNGSFNSGNVQPGGSATQAFPSAGTFGYRCTVHAGMVGTIIVD